MFSRLDEPDASARLHTTEEPLQVGYGTNDSQVQPAPLNRERGFLPWPHFNPGQWLDTNPSFVRLGDDDAWAVFTRYTVPPKPGVASIWVVRVDALMQPLGSPMPVIGHGIDPRAIRTGERVLVFYVIIERDEEGVINGSSIALTEFAVVGDQWTQLESFRLPKHPIEKELPPDAQHNWEKNWVPFAIGQQSEGREQPARIGLIYSHDPWDVITLSVDPGRPRRFESLHSSHGIQWNYGTIRGGTPPIQYDDENLVTFFHSSQVVGSRNVYSVGACLFLAQPPYTPISMTTRPLLIAPYRSGANRFGWCFAGSVVFPLGAERTDEGYRLLCGRDDGEIASFVVRRQELAERFAAPDHGAVGTVHAYRGGKGARLPLNGLLYVPDPTPVILELPMINFVRMIVERGRTFVDVGSHIGYYTMGLATGFERVIAFEPSRSQYGWLRRNVSLNAYDHVLCEQVALGEAAGTTTLSLNSGVGVGQGAIPDRRNILCRYTVPVEVLDDRALTDVDLIKIDARGPAVSVLRGSARTIAASRPVILIDLAEVSRLDVQGVLSGMDYSLEFLFPLSPKRALCLPQERRRQYEWFL